jgi:hypothetical protein
MTDNPDVPAAKVDTIEFANSGSESAPFIYFDAALLYGMLQGTIQIELAAATIVPAPGGKTRTVHVITAHLRCSPSAALSLKNAIDSAFLLNAPTEGKAN